MKLFKLAFAALGLGTLATPSLANDATIYVTLTVPLRCDVSVLNTHVEAGRVVMDLARSCNSRHQLVVSSSPASDLGEVTVRSRDDARLLRAGGAVFSHKEQYAAQVEQYTFELPNASAEAAIAFAGTIAVRVEAR